MSPYYDAKLYREEYTTAEAAEELPKDKIKDDQESDILNKFLKLLNNQDDSEISSTKIMPIHRPEQKENPGSSTTEHTDENEDKHGTVVVKNNKIKKIYEYSRNLFGTIFYLSLIPLLVSLLTEALPVLGVLPISTGSLSIAIMANYYLSELENGQTEKR